MADRSADVVLVEGLTAALVATMGRLRLFCGRCWTEGRFDPRGRSGNEAAEREEAARHFARLGWQVASTPVCPRCVKESRD
jgi:hypothetical protein